MSVLRRSWFTLLLVASCVVVSFPLVWMLLGSLKSPHEALKWFPGRPNLDAYRKVAGVVNVGRSLRNSALIAGVTTVGIVITSLMAGFVFAKYRFAGRNMLFGSVVATMFLPPIVTLIPLYRLVGWMGLDGDLRGVILPNLANAFGIFLLRQFILGVPDELIEAARIDGASELRILFQIVTPIVMPAVATLTLFAFVYHWNSYLWPLTVLQGNTDQYPIVLSLGRLLSYTRSAQNTNQVMAGAAMAVLPPLVLFVVLQRTFVRTMARTGLTG